MLFAQQPDEKEKVNLSFEQLFPLRSSCDEVVEKKP